MKQWSNLVETSEMDGHAIISALIVMTQLQSDFKFLDEDHASELTKKLCKNISHSHKDFLKSFLKIEDTEILKQLDDVPRFDTDIDFFVSQQCHFDFIHCSQTQNGSFVAEISLFYRP